MLSCTINRDIEYVFFLDCDEIVEGKKAAWFYPMFAVTLYSAVIIVLSLYYAFLPGSGVIEDGLHPELRVVPPSMYLSR